MNRTRLILGLLAMLTVLGAPALARAAEALDINTASLTELMTLPGLGKKRAEEIVRRRLQQPFRRTSDLMRIRGIGRRTYLKLRPLVRVAAEAPATPLQTAHAPALAPAAIP
jgi:competence protein ComEA